VKFRGQYVSIRGVRGVIMNIIIKGSQQFKVREDLKTYIETKFRKFERMVKEPATLEIMLADVRGDKKGVDKVFILLQQFLVEKILNI
jgi:ribosome-associated translation inhibitor RaiA